MSEETKTLAQKLVEVMGIVTSVNKKGHNKDQDYDYVKAADVAKAIRPHLVSRGILMIPNVVNTVTFEMATAKGSIRRGMDMTVEYTFMDTTNGETLKFTGFGSGLDNGDKYSYKAQTGALKYALRQFFVLPDEKGDPENEARTNADLLKPFPCSGRVLSVMPKDKGVLVKLTNDLGEFYCAAGTEPNISHLLDTEGREIDLMVTDTGKQYKNCPMFRVHLVNPTPAEIVEAKKGKAKGAADGV